MLQRAPGCLVASRAVCERLRGILECYALPGQLSDGMWNANLLAGETEPASNLAPKQSCFGASLSYRRFLFTRLFRPHDTALR